MSVLRLTNVGRAVTMVSPSHVSPDPKGTVFTGAFIDLDATGIRFVGPASDAPDLGGVVVEHLDCGGRAVLPALVDCHTHLVFGGDRRDEFARRAGGASYADIHREGGGIARTVALTRAASDDELLDAAVARAAVMLARGVGTIEVKSGYGLDLETELRILRVARRVADRVPVRIITTFLGAHTVPVEFKGRSDAYVDLVCNEMIPRVAAEGLATFCDVFCEEGVFTIAQAERILMAGKAAGLRPKLHADQLHHTGAARLGVRVGAVSVDHLEQIDDEDVRALAVPGGPVAVLLPASVVFLGMKAWPPARALLDAGVPVALATDLNPGSSMCDDLPLQTTFACTRLGLSPAEALRAITASAAAAVGLEGRAGILAPGAFADVVVLGTSHEDDVPYRFGAVPPYAVITGGRVVRGPGRGT